MKEKSPFSKVAHIGIVVRDIEKVIDYYQSLGIGPFESFKNIVALERKLQGKPVAPDSIKSKIRIVKMGTVELEFIEPVEGETPWKRFLETKGEGINHIGFLVDDLDVEEAKLIDKGLTVLYRSRFENGGGAAYFDTGKIGGFLIELIQFPPD